MRQTLITRTTSLYDYSNILDEKDDQEVEPSSWNAWNAWNSWNDVYSETRHRFMLHQPGLPINLKCMLNCRCLFTVKQVNFYAYI